MRQPIAPGVTNSAARIPGIHTTGNITAVADEEYEYEYNENETEDFYFTLDLTTHVPDALVQPGPVQKAPPSTRPTAHSEPAATQDGDSESSEDDDDDEEPSAGQLQLVDLHTNAPLVKLDERVYSCYWSTDIGTQLHIAKAGHVKSSVQRPGTVLDVLGTTQTRLVGVPVTLKARKETRKSQPSNPRARKAPSIDGESDIDAHHSERSTPAPATIAVPGQPLQIDRDLVRHDAGQVQASFLERLSHIKLKKGERDQVPIYSVKSFHHVDPAKQEQLKQAGLRLDAEKAKQAKEDEIVATGQRPRKRRRKLTYAEKGMQYRDNSLALNAGRPARDFVSQSLGFHDQAPPSDRNGRWARLDRNGHAPGPLNGDGLELDMDEPEHVEAETEASLAATTERTPQMAATTTSQATAVYQNDFTRESMDANVQNNHQQPDPA